MPEIYSDIITTKYNAVNYVHDNYLRSARYWDRNYKNCIENWRYYWGKNPELGLGQWPAAALARMIQQGRAPITYNFIMPTVDAIAGGIMQAPFDPEYIPVIEGQVPPDLDEIVSALKKAMYSDKELMDWKSVYLQLVVHGLVHDGCIKMVVSDDYSPLGNIGFNITLPGACRPDPYWKDYSSKTCEVCHHETWHTAESLKKIYPKKADKLKYEAAKQKIVGDQYGPNNGVVPYGVTENQWGSQYRLIEEYRMVEHTKTVERVITSFGDIEIPDIDDNEKPKWLNENIPDWDWDLDRIYERKEKRKKCVVRAAAPGLVNDELLEDGPIEIQIGRLPFFWWAANRMNGEPHSIVDSVKDPQTNINYGEAMIQHKLQSEGGGGAQFVDTTLFVSNEEARRFAKHRNAPNEVFRIKPGLMQKGIVPAKPVVKAPFPNEVYENVNHIVNLVWPHISKTTPTTLARPEPGNETSGRLFQMLKIQGDQLVYTIHYGLRVFWNDVYEAYFLQSIKTYSNEKLPRTFEFGQERITLNEVVTGPDGQEQIKNDVSRLMNMRAKVIISEKAESPTEKMHNVQTLAEYQRSIPPENLVSRALVNSEIAKNIEQFSKESRAKFREAAELEYETAKTSMELQKVKMDLELQQAKRALAAKQQEEQKAPNATGGGAQMAGGMPAPETAATPENISEAPAPSPEEQANQEAQQAIPQQTEGVTA